MKIERVPGGDDANATSAGPTPGAKSPSRYATWIVGLAPAVAIAAAALTLYAMIADPRGWIGFVPASLTFGCLLTGFFGGMGLAIHRVNPWWLLVAVASLALGFLGLQAVAAMAMGHMH